MDPRKRLQVLNSNNPSLRMNVAPQQQLKVVTDRPNNLRIGNNVIRPNPNGRVERAPKRGGINVGSVANTVAKDVGGFLPRLAMNYSQFFGNLGTRAAGGKAETSKDFWNDPVTSRVQKWSGADGTARQIGGDIAQAGLTIAGGGAGKIAAAVGKTAVPRFAAKAAPVAYEAGVGGAFNLASSLSQDELRKDNAAQTFGIGAAFGGAARPVAGVIGRVADKVLPSRKALTSLSKSVAKSTDARSIESSLKVAPEVADYLAGQQDPAHVKTILKQLNIDPRIQLSSTDKKRLQDEGIENVEIGETPYGAEYNNSTIRFSDPSQATPDKIYHELGHHIWRTKLSPEEKAVFANIEGGAKKSAKGRKDYTEDDLISEDFSDFIRKALTGRIDEIPESIRGVVIKYTGVAQKELTEATRTMTQPGAQIVESATKATPEQTSFIKEGAEAPKPGDEITDANAKTANQEELQQAAAPVKVNAEETPTDVSRAVEQISQKTNGTTQDEIQEILDATKKAEAANVDKSKLVSQEKAARIAKARAAYEAAGGGVAGTRAKLKALRGAYSKSAYNSPDFKPETVTNVLDDVESSNLRDFEKLNVQNAWLKIAGESDEMPTDADIDKVRKFFNQKYGEGVGDEIATAIKEAMVNEQTAGDVVANIAGLPRALMATGDLSGGFRQAAPLGSRYPKLWARANKESVKYALNNNYYEQEMRKIADADDFAVISDKMKVDLPGAAGDVADEGFINADYAEKIPVYGKVIIKPAERAYQGVLTKLRYEAAQVAIAKAGGVDNYLAHMDELFGDKADDAMKAYGEVINTFTGRGGKKGGVLDSHMKTAATLLFAPRLWAANINRLRPDWYYKMYKANPEAGKLALQASGTFWAMAGTILGLASVAGAAVGTDPRSADFGKIKVGNTRYDVLGGQQQNIVQIVRQFKGEKVKSDTGEVDELGDGYGVDNRFDLLLDMIQNKSNPVLGYALRGLQTGKDDDGNPLTRTDQYGNERNFATELGWMGVPLGAQGAYETAKDQGNIVKGVLMNAPSFIGAGVQTYGPVASKDKGKEVDGKPTFKGKVTPEMVLDNDGKPMLDEKGRVIKAKFEDDATDLEKQAELKSKQKEAYTKKAKESLSKEDRAIYKMGQADIDALDDKQKAKFKQIKKYVESYGKKTEIPDGIKSPVAKDFYSKYNTMTKEDQKHWLTEAPEENSKKIAEQLNKERTKGLPEFTASNALAKAYAEFEKDINTHPEYSATDLRHKTKEFQKFALKLNYSESIRDLYQNASKTEADLEYVIKDGKVSQADLDKAIELDNHLYSSGLNSTLTFSKTFRKDYGYGIPAKGGAVSGSGSDSGGGGRRGDETPRTHLVKLLPNFKPGTTTQAPSFSGKARTTPKIDAGDLPGVKKNKVNIKL